MTTAPDPEFFATLKRLQATGSEWLLEVNVAEQRMRVFRSVGGPASAAVYENESEFPVSTSRHGVGCRENSLQTPPGLHRIAEKIGDGEPAGTVFRGRRVVGHVDRGMPDALITSRILWLEGMEEGRNCGVGVDSHERYIYIHGTADQSTIGRPASSGCVHLADRDLLPLFDRVSIGTMVWIRER